MFDNKHLTAIIIKPSFFKNSSFSLAFHANYFKISEISLIRCLLNLKEFIFVPKNNGIFFKKLPSEIYSVRIFFKKLPHETYSVGTFFKKLPHETYSVGTFFKKLPHETYSVGTFFKKLPHETYSLCQFFKKWTPEFTSLFKKSKNILV